MTLLSLKCHTSALTITASFPTVFPAIFKETAKLSGAQGCSDEKTDLTVPAFLCYSEDIKMWQVQSQQQSLEQTHKDAYNVYADICKNNIFIIKLCHFMAVKYLIG